MFESVGAFLEDVSDILEVVVNNLRSVSLAEIDRFWSLVCMIDYLLILLFNSVTYLLLNINPTNQFNLSHSLFIINGQFISKNESIIL